jgi:hypothetical protein
VFREAIFLGVMLKHHFPITQQVQLQVSNTAVYGVVDCGSSTSIGTAYGAVFDFAQFAGTRASAAPCVHWLLGEDSAATYGAAWLTTRLLFEVGRPGKQSLAGGLAVTAGTPTTVCGSNSGFSWLNG